MVDGKAGTGNTPVEKMLAMIFSLWYLASIFPVILTYLSGSTKGLQVSILGPFFYHLMISINSFLYFESLNICNQDVTSANKIAAIHAVLAVACLMVYRN